MRIHGRPRFSTQKAKSPVSTTKLSLDLQAQVPCATASCDTLSPQFSLSESPLESPHSAPSVVETVVSDGCLKGTINPD